METSGKHIRPERIIILVLIVLIIVGIVVGAVLLTKKKDNKATSNKELASSKAKKVEEVVEDEDINNAEEKNIEETETEEDKKDEVKEDVKEDEKNNNNGGLEHALPVSNPNAVQLCKDAQSGNEKNIYLTFDDGPSSSVTPQVLKTLKEYNVPATFFVLGSRAELYPELIKQEFNEGHYIANHGYSHKYSSIYSSVQAVLDEYDRTESAIQAALGTTEFHSYLFRFPGGSSGGPYDSLKQEAKSILESRGIASTNWNCLTGDAEGNGKSSVDQLQSRLYETANGWVSLVILMHDTDGKQNTAEALPSIIEHYKNEGYTFKNYYDIFQ